MIWLRLGILLLLIAPAPALAQTPGSLGGSWPSGSWHADNSSHHGPLRATFTPLGTSHYQVDFTGRFAKVIPFRYSVVLNVVGTAGDTTFLAGQSRLPIFGTFQYQAAATPTSFQATYRHRRYSGQFLLQR